MHDTHVFFTITDGTVIVVYCQSAHRFLDLSVAPEHIYICGIKPPVSLFSDTRIADRTDYIPESKKVPVVGIEILKAAHTELFTYPYILRVLTECKQLVT